MDWNQDFIKWNPDEWEGIERLQVSSNMLWLPDITLYSSIGDSESSLKSHFSTDVILRANGKHVWLSPAIFESTCAIHVTDFPFDKQNCQMKFGSWINDMSRFNLVIPQVDIPVITEDYVENSEWKLENAYLKRYEGFYAGFSKKYVDLKMHIHLKRKPLHHFLNTIAPCLTLNALMLLSFYLPPQSGERVSLTITVFLAITVFQQLVSESLPKNSDSFPRLSMFYFYVVLLGCLSLISSCFVIIMLTKAEHADSHPVPSWIRKLGFLKTCKHKCATFHRSPVISNNNVVVALEYDENTLKRSEEPIDTVGAANIYSCGFTCLPIDKQWRTASERLDKMFFWMFFFASVAGLVSMLLPSYIKSL